MTHFAVLGLLPPRRRRLPTPLAEGVDDAANVGIVVGVAPARQPDSVSPSSPTGEHA